MPAPSKYPAELKERATRMAVEARRDVATKSGAYRRIGEQLGVNPEALRNWVQRAETDQGSAPAPPPTMPSDWSNSNARCASYAAPTRSCARRRLSSRRSSTARPSDVRVHRRTPR